MLGQIPLGVLGTSAGKVVKLRARVNKYLPKTERLPLAPRKKLRLAELYLQLLEGCRTACPIN
jgi:hypothetical protein